ncbi:hypothetical protein ITP53_38715 [Nonomuraea sp. K274]|uniref:Uncharacterized protein n=1 Tax=Nonomuraea cypriaca TaxID=1187855 RepID=A0A931AJW7_9ACTN|nr:hypothetical protein [Nonomuraea cypriaca]MBF8191530.1 hypothetical protein [Nonomuraea cypriaca]
MVRSGRELADRTDDSGQPEPTPADRADDSGQPEPTLADRADDSGQPEPTLAEPAPASVALDQAPRVPWPGPVVRATPRGGQGEPTQEIGEPEPAATPAGQDAQTGETREASDRRAQAAALLAQDPAMTGAALARALGVHETTGRKYRREALNGNGRP